MGYGIHNTFRLHNEDILLNYRSCYSIFFNFGNLISTCLGNSGTYCVNKFPSFHDNKEEFIKAITDYQQDLIDGGVIGVLTYDELLKMSDKELDTLQVWTESPCLHKKYVSKPEEKDNKAYNNQPVLTKDDFINLGVDPSRIPEFYQSEFGVKIKRFKDVSFVEKRKEALRLLNDWLKTFESI